MKKYTKVIICLFKILQIPRARKNVNFTSNKATP